MEKKITKENKQIVEYASVGIVTFLLLMLLFKWKQLAPFGNNSLASMDAYYQYLDFFAYLKDVFTGSNQIDYSFSIGLGQTGIGVFSYYLSSPFNVLLLFFSKENINVFFHIAVAIKLSTAAITMTIYLKKRFRGQMEKQFVFLLSLSYALMQYNIAQSSNIMWMDGVYMLPLILLGIYRLVRERRIVLLSVSVGVSILFSWYSAGINCLFTAIWFVLEWALVNIEEKKSIKQNVQLFFLYIWGMMLGVLLSAVLFYPTVIALRGGKGTFDWWMFRNELRGNLLSVIWNYSLGAVSSQDGGVSLYCGSLVLLGCIGLFCTKQISWKKKMVCALLVVVSIMIFYWQPFFAAFSLLKHANSYWYRYSYVSIFSLIFLAGMFFSVWKQSEKSWAIVTGGGIAYAAILILLNQIYKARDEKQIYYSALFAVVIGVILALYKTEKIRKKLVISLTLIAAVGVELCFSTVLLMKEYQATNAETFVSYERSNQKHVDYLKERDQTPYRIANTTSRNHSGNNIVAIYNEAMNFNYWGIPSYTSATVNRQLSFLNTLGYREEGLCISVVNTSIVPSDSLLGVKYVMSPYDIKGYEKLDYVSEDNKNLYYNPYALPMAFTYPVNNMENRTSYWNSFDYINGLYNRLLGYSTEIFTPAEVEKRIIDNTTVEYVIHNIGENQSLYGNLPWSWEMNASINVNDAYTQGYSQWLSPSVFYIPSQEGTARITVTAGDISGIMAEDFYLLNLDVLEQVSAEIKTRAAEIKRFENGHISCSVPDAAADQLLYLSVPYDEGWSITNNGKKIRPGGFAGTMISIPLHEGKNDIVMEYTIPGLKKGILMSVAGIILLALSYLLREKAEKRIKKEK